MNLYGFAGGDPVNFSDPFGLCPPCSLVDPEFVFKAVKASLPVGKSTSTSGEIRSAGLADPSAFLVGGGGIARAASRVATKGVATFFRGVSAGEASQVAAEGVLRAVPQSVEGKFLTNTVEAAAEWGRRLNGEGARVVEIKVTEAQAKAMEFLGRIDGIGDAWFTRMENLKGAAVRIIK